MRILILSLCSLSLFVACKKEEAPAKIEPARKAVNEKAEKVKTAASAPAPAGKPGVLFVWPQNNSKVFQDFNVVMGVKNMTVTPAGKDIADKNKGHHHLIVDGTPIAKGQAVPADKKHIHFGKGQTNTRMNLAPGEHTITMQFADGAHISYGPKMATSLKVNVIPRQKTGVSFKNVKDGDTVKSPVKLEFGVEGFEIQPAGKEILNKTTGHHHLIIDGKFVEPGRAIPATKTSIHFGKGQTETTQELSPGKHTLTLQFGDALHLSYGEPMSKTITVNVE